MTVDDDDNESISPGPSKTSQYANTDSQINSQSEDDSTLVSAPQQELHSSLPDGVCTLQKAINIAKEQLRYINKTPPKIRNTLEFVKEVRNRLKFLHCLHYKYLEEDHNAKIPKSKEFYDLLVRYVELEYESLYHNKDEGKCNKSDEVEAEERICCLLEYMLKFHARQMTAGSMPCIYEIKILTKTNQAYWDDDKIIMNLILKFLKSAGALEEMEDIINNKEVLLSDALYESSTLHHIIDDEEDENTCGAFDESIKNEPMVDYGDPDDPESIAHAELATFGFCSRPPNNYPRESSILPDFDDMLQPPKIEELSIDETSSMSSSLISIRDTEYPKISAFNDDNVLLSQPLLDFKISLASVICKSPEKTPPKVIKKPINQVIEIISDDDDEDDITEVHKDLSITIDFLGDDERMMYILKPNDLKKSVNNVINGDLLSTNKQLVNITNNPIHSNNLNKQSSGEVIKENNLIVAKTTENNIKQELNLSTNKSIVVDDNIICLDDDSDEEIITNERVIKAKPLKSETEILKKDKCKSIKTRNKTIGLPKPFTIDLDLEESVTKLEKSTPPIRKRIIIDKKTGKMQRILGHIDLDSDDDNEDAILDKFNEDLSDTKSNINIIDVSKLVAKDVSSGSEMDTNSMEDELNQVEDSTSNTDIEQIIDETLDDGIETNLPIDEIVESPKIITVENIKLEEFNQSITSLEIVATDVIPNDIENGDNPRISLDQIIVKMDLSPPPNVIEQRIVVMKENVAVATPLALHNEIVEVVSIKPVHPIAEIVFTPSKSAIENIKFGGTQNSDEIIAKDVNPIVEEISMKTLIQTVTENDKLTDENTDSTPKIIRANKINILENEIITPDKNKHIEVIKKHNNSASIVAKSKPNIKEIAKEVSVIKKVPKKVKKLSKISDKSCELKVDVNPKGIESSSISENVPEIKSIDKNSTQSILNTEELITAKSLEESILDEKVNKTVNIIETLTLEEVVSDFDTSVGGKITSTPINARQKLRKSGLKKLMHKAKNIFNTSKGIQPSNDISADYIWESQENAMHNKLQLSEMVDVADVGTNTSTDCVKNSPEINLNLLADIAVTQEKSICNKVQVTPQNKKIKRIVSTKGGRKSRKKSCDSPNVRVTRSRALTRNVEMKIAKAKKLKEPKSTKLITQSESSSQKINVISSKELPIYDFPKNIHKSNMDQSDESCDSDEGNLVIAEEPKIPEIIDENEGTVPVLISILDTGEDYSILKELSKLERKCNKMKLSDSKPKSSNNKNIDTYKANISNPILNSQKMITANPVASFEINEVTECESLQPEIVPDFIEISSNLNVAKIGLSNISGVDGLIKEVTKKMTGMLPPIQPEPVPDSTKNLPSTSINIIHIKEITKNKLLQPVPVPELANHAEAIPAHFDFPVQTVSQTVSNSNVVIESSNVDASKKTTDHRIEAILDLSQILPMDLSNKSLNTSSENLTDIVEKTKLEIVGKAIPHLEVVSDNPQCVEQPILLMENVNRIASKSATNKKKLPKAQDNQKLVQGKIRTKAQLKSFTPTPIPDKITKTPIISKSQRRRSCDDKKDKLINIQSIVPEKLQDFLSNFDLIKCIKQNNPRNQAQPLSQDNPINSICINKINKMNANTRKITKSLNLVEQIVHNLKIEKQLLVAKNMHLENTSLNVNTIIPNIHKVDSLSKEDGMIVNEKDALSKEEDFISKEKDALSEEEEDVTAKEKYRISNEEEVLIKEKDCISNEKNVLTKENDGTSNEKDALCKENYEISNEDVLIQDENVLTKDEDMLTKDDDVLNEEKYVISKAKEALSKEGVETYEKSNVLTKEKYMPSKEDVITKEKYSLSNKEDVLTIKDVISETKVTLCKEEHVKTKEKYAISNKNVLTKEKDALSNQEDELSMEENALSVEKDVLAKENDVLTEDKDGLSEEKDVLTKGKDGLSNKKDVLTKGKDGLSEKKDVSTKEKYGLFEEKDVLTKGKDGLSEKKDESTKEKYGLSEEKDVLTKGKVGLSKEKDVLTKSKVGLSKEKDVLTKSKVGLSKEKDVLTKGKDGLSEKKDVSTKVKDGLSEKKDVSTKVKDGLSEEKDVLTKGNDGLSKKKYVLAKDKDGLSEEKDVLTKCKDGLSNEENVINMDKDGFSNEKNRLSKEENALSIEEDVLTKNKDGLSKEKDVLTPKKDGLSKEEVINMEKDGLSIEENVIDKEKDALYKEENALSKKENALSIEENASSTIDQEIVEDIDNKSLLFDNSINKSIIEIIPTTPNKDTESELGHENKIDLNATITIIEDQSRNLNISDIIDSSIIEEPQTTDKVPIADNLMPDVVNSNISEKVISLREVATIKETSTEIIKGNDDKTNIIIPEISSECIGNDLIHEKIDLSKECKISQLKDVDKSNKTTTKNNKVENDLINDKVDSIKSTDAKVDKIQDKSSEIILKSKRIRPSRWSNKPENNIIVDTNKTDLSETKLHVVIDATIIHKIKPEVELNDKVKSNHKIEENKDDKRNKIRSESDSRNERRHRRNNERLQECDRPRSSSSCDSAKSKDNKSKRDKHYDSKELRSSDKSKSRRDDKRSSSRDSRSNSRNSTDSRSKYSSDRSTSNKYSEKSDKKVLLDKLPKPSKNESKTLIQSKEMSKSKGIEILDKRKRKSEDTHELSVKIPKLHDKKVEKSKETDKSKKIDALSNKTSTEIKCESKKSSKKDTQKREIISKDINIVDTIISTEIPKPENTKPKIELVHESLKNTEPAGKLEEIILKEKKVIDSLPKNVIDASTIDSNENVKLCEKVLKEEKDNKVDKKLIDVAKKLAEVLKKNDTNTVVLKDKIKISDKVKNKSCEVATKSGKITNKSTEVATKSLKSTNQLTEVSTKSLKMTNQLTEVATKSGKNTNKSTEVATKSQKMTNQLTEAPTKSAKISNKSIENQTKSTENPTKSVTITNKSTESPNKMVKITKKSSEESSKFGKISNQLTEATTKLVAITNTTTDVSYKSLKNPNKSTEDPTKSEKIINQLTEVPTKSVAIANKSTEVISNCVIEDENKSTEVVNQLIDPTNSTKISLITDLNNATKVVSNSSEDISETTNKSTNNIKDIYKNFEELSKTCEKIKLDLKLSDKIQTTKDVSKTAAKSTEPLLKNKSLDTASKKLNKKPETQIVDKTNKINTQTNKIDKLDVSLVANKSGKSPKLSEDTKLEISQNASKCNKLTTKLDSHKSIETCVAKLVPKKSNDIAFTQNKSIEESGKANTKKSIKKIIGPLEENELLDNKAGISIKEIVNSTLINEEIVSHQLKPMSIFDEIVFDCLNKQTGESAKVISNELTDVFKTHAAKIHTQSKQIEKSVEIKPTLTQTKQIEKSVEIKPTPTQTKQIEKSVEIKPTPTQIKQIEKSVEIKATPTRLAEKRLAPFPKDSQEFEVMKKMRKQPLMDVDQFEESVRNNMLTYSDNKSASFRSKDLIKKDNHKNKTIDDIINSLKDNKLLIDTNRISEDPINITPEIKDLDKSVQPIIAAGFAEVFPSEDAITKFETILEKPLVSPIEEIALNHEKILDPKIDNQLPILQEELLVVNELPIIHEMPVLEKVVSELNVTPTESFQYAEEEKIVADNQFPMHTDLEMNYANEKPINKDDEIYNEANSNESGGYPIHLDDMQKAPNVIVESLPQFNQSQTMISSESESIGNRLSDDINQAPNIIQDIKTCNDSSPLSTLNNVQSSSKTELIEVPLPSTMVPFIANEHFLVASPNHIVPSTFKMKNDLPLATMETNFVIEGKPLNELIKESCGSQELKMGPSIGVRDYFISNDVFSYSEENSELTESFNELSKLNANNIESDVSNNQETGVNSELNSIYTESFNVFSKLNANNIEPDGSNNQETGHTMIPDASGIGYNFMDDDSNRFFECTGIPMMSVERMNKLLQPPIHYHDDITTYPDNSCEKSAQIISDDINIAGIIDDMTTMQQLNANNIKEKLPYIEPSWASSDQISGLDFNEGSGSNHSIVNIANDFAVASLIELQNTTSYSNSLSTTSLNEDLDRFFYKEEATFCNTSNKNMHCYSANSSLEQSNEVPGASLETPTRIFTSPPILTPIDYITTPKQSDLKRDVPNKRVKQLFKMEPKIIKAKEKKIDSTYLARRHSKTQICAPIKTTNQTPPVIKIPEPDPIDKIIMEPSAKQNVRTSTYNPKKIIETKNNQDLDSSNIDLKDIGKRTSKNVLLLGSKKITSPSENPNVKRQKLNPDKSRSFAETGESIDNKIEKKRLEIEAIISNNPVIVEKMDNEIPTREQEHLAQEIKAKNEEIAKLRAEINDPNALDKKGYNKASKTVRPDMSTVLNKISKIVSQTKRKLSVDDDDDPSEQRDAVSSDDSDMETPSVDIINTKKSKLEERKGALSTEQMNILFDQLKSTPTTRKINVIDPEELSANFEKEVKHTSTEPEDNKKQAEKKVCHVRPLARQMPSTPILHTPILHTPIQPPLNPPNSYTPYRQVGSRRDRHLQEHRGTPSPIEYRNDRPRDRRQRLSSDGRQRLPPDGRPRTDRQSVSTDNRQRLPPSRHHMPVDERQPMPMESRHRTPSFEDGYPCDYPRGGQSQPTSGRRQVDYYTGESNPHNRSHHYDARHQRFQDEQLSSVSFNDSASSSSWSNTSSRPSNPPNNYCYYSVPPQSTSLYHHNQKDVPMSNICLGNPQNSANKLNADIYLKSLDKLLSVPKVSFQLRRTNPD